MTKKPSAMEKRVVGFVVFVIIGSVLLSSSSSSSSNHHHAQNYQLNAASSATTSWYNYHDKTTLTTTTPIPSSRSSHSDSDSDSNSPIYWNMSCPLELRPASVAFAESGLFDSPEHVAQGTRDAFRARATLAREFALAQDVPQRFARHAPAALEGRRTVLVGDSIFRQVFIGMACLWPSSSSSTSSSSTSSSLSFSYTVGWVDIQPDSTDCNDARLRVHGHHPHDNNNEKDNDIDNNNGELLFAPKAGGLLDFQWQGKHMPISSTEKGVPSWIDACHARQPFQFVTKRLPSSEQQHTNTNSHSHTNLAFDNDKYEVVTLTSNDAVILNAGLHIPMRPDNLRRIQELLDCMDQAASDHNSNNNNDNNNNDWPWPHVAYAVTSLQHFDTPSGNWEGGATGATAVGASASVPASMPLHCKPTNPNREYQQEDVRYFDRRVPLIGTPQTLNYTALGGLHVGGPVGPDCTHWFQPGVPDVLATDVVEHLASLGPRS